MWASADGLLYQQPISICSLACRLTLTHNCSLKLVSGMVTSEASRWSAKWIEMPLMLLDPKLGMSGSKFAYNVNPGNAILAAVSGNFIIT